MNKKELRREVAVVTKKLTKEYCTEADAQITDKILALPEYQNAKTIFCFVSMPEEIDTTQIIEDAFAKGKRVGVPKCISKGIMEVYEIASLDELEAVPPYGIREPKDTTKLITPEELDFAIIPCVSCSSDGKRLGHGGGYYDRYLAKTGAFKAVVCRRKQMCEDIPMDEYDLTMDCVVSD